MNYATRNFALRTYYAWRKLNDVIQTWKGKAAENLWKGKRSKLPASILRRAASKLAMLDAATSLDQLRIPPSNHLESLRGNRGGQYSIRINDQWRICFLWREGNAYDVEITDYH